MGLGFKTPKEAIEVRASAATPAGRAARRPERWTPPKCAFLAPTPAAPPAQSSYVDKKCPFTGNVSIRGRILKGIVISTKMRRTIIVRRDYLRYVPKYRRCARRPSSSARPRVSPGRRLSRARVPGLPPGSRVGPLLAPSSFEKRHRNVAAHCSPAFKVKEGDVATIGQCRCARRGAPSSQPSSRPARCLTTPLCPLASPLSKTVRFNVLKVEETALDGQAARKQFRMF